MLRLLSQGLDFSLKQAKQENDEKDAERKPKRASKRKEASKEEPQSETIVHDTEHAETIHVEGESVAAM